MARITTSPAYCLTLTGSLVSLLVFSSFCSILEILAVSCSVKWYLYRMIRFFVAVSRLFLSYLYNGIR